MPQILYIHGIGNHGPAEPLKREWDLALFGREMGERAAMVSQSMSTPMPLMRNARTSSLPIKFSTRGARRSLGAGWATSGVASRTEQGGGDEPHGAAHDDPLGNLNQPPSSIYTSPAPA